MHHERPVVILHTIQNGTCGGDVAQMSFQLWFFWQGVEGILEATGQASMAILRAIYASLTVLIPIVLPGWFI